MTFHHARFEDEPQGQATFGMANLRNKTTGLQFIVFISQKDGAKHDVRVKVAPGPKVRPDQMGSYQLRPFQHVGGYKLDARDELRLEQWIQLNIDVLVAYWSGDIDFTEDAIDRLMPV